VDGVALFLLLQQRCAFAIPFLEKVGGLPRQSAPAASTSATATGSSSRDSTPCARSTQTGSPSTTR
jgi:hypothetical protein